MVDYSDLAQPLNNQQSTNSQYADLASPLQGGISQTQSPLQDFGQGLVSGLTEIPRAINKVISPVTDAVAYLPAEALRGLTGQQLQNYGQYQQDIAQKEQQMNQVPQTGYGQTGRFIGSAIPTLAMGAEGIGTQALIGGGLGVVNAINKGENLPQIATSAGEGALASAITGGLGNIAGNTYKTLAPVMARSAGIAGNDFKTMLQNAADMPMVQTLLSNLPNVPDKLKQAGQVVTQAKMDLVNKPPVDPQIIEDIITQAINKKTTPGADVSTVGNELKPVLDNLRANYISPVNIGSQQNPSNLYGDIPLPRLQEAKDYLYNETVFNPAKAGYSDKSNAILKDIAKQINNKIEEAHPALADANDAYHKAVAASKFNQLAPDTGNPFTGNIFHGFGLNRLPIIHGLGLAGNEINNKLAPYLPAAYSNALTQYMNQQGGQ